MIVCPAILSSLDSFPCSFNKPLLSKLSPFACYSSWFALCHYVLSCPLLCQDLTPCISQLLYLLPPCLLLLLWLVGCGFFLKACTVGMTDRHIPIGVLFDLLVAEPERPWNLTVKTSDDVVFLPFLILKVVSIQCHIEGPWSLLRNCAWNLEINCRKGLREIVYHELRHQICQLSWAPYDLTHVVIYGISVWWFLFHKTQDLKVKTKQKYERQSSLSTIFLPSLSTLHIEWLYWRRQLSHLYLVYLKIECNNVVIYG